LGCRPLVFGIVVLEGKNGDDEGNKDAAPEQ
jgi:hypothetical protein